MTLRTLVLIAATGMVVTGVAVWTTIEPARGSTRTGPAAEPAIPAPPPEDHSHFVAGKTLMVEGRLGHAVLPAGADSQTFLFVDVSAADAVAKAPAPLALSIAIDRSGSMKGKRMTNAIAAARTAIQRLRDGDMVSVVTFNTGVEVAVAPTMIDAVSKARVLDELSQPRTTGDTCISCGIDKAMQLVGGRADMVNRILLLSDGAATAGVRDVDGFQRIAEDCRRMGASVTTIGVDVEFDEKLMTALARSSNGHHFFVADPAGLPSIFDKEMEALTRTVANGSELTIDLSPGVFVEHVYDRTATNNGSQLVVPLGAFAAGERKTLLARVRVPGGIAGDRLIAAVRLRYDDLVEARPGTCEGSLATRVTTDASALSPLDGLVSARVSASETAEALEEANSLFRAGRGAEAREVLRRGEDRVKNWHRDAVRAAPAARVVDVDESFDKQQATLSSAGTGFQPAAPTVATTPGSWNGTGAGDGDAKAGKRAPKADPDRPAQAQIRQNASDAMNLSD